MKKRLIGMMLLTMLALTACGSEEKVIGGEVQNNVTGSAQSGQEQGQGTGQGAGEASQTANTKGYSFTYQGTVIEIDADMAPVLQALGEPVSYFEAASCAFEGLDKIYTYQSFIVKTYPQKDKDLISTIVLMDDSVATPEGLCIGSSTETLYNAYGKEYTEQGDSLVYEKDGMKLQILVSGDEVTSIQYFSTVLDE